ncbi:MAG TPA: hypothetical protein VNO74_05710 [Methylomirabilota bacterium]|nr:hypothetical protein [Methylomirabilota bacterium]
MSIFGRRKISPINQKKINFLNLLATLFLIASPCVGRGRRIVFDAAGEGPFLNFLAHRMCGAPGNCATQMSLTLTLSRQRERELDKGGELGKRGRKLFAADSGSAHFSEAGFCLMRIALFLAR